MAVAVPMKQSPLANITYEDLYRRWELGNWRSTEIDFSVDREQWKSDFTEFDRKAALWNYALFFWGEDAVTDGLSPYIDAAPLEEQKYFLATQQADEARHAVFFNRFINEVVGIDGDGVGGTLSAIEPQLTWGFKKVFERLDKMCAELRANPSIPQLAAGVALYHMVIEATLAQVGQHFITSYLTERDLLPGFRAGMEKVAADEQRHIGFGVKLLSDLRQMDPEVPHAVADIVREVAPWVIAVIVPPGFNERYIETFGSSFEELGGEGLTSLEGKLRSAGMPLDELPGPPAIAIPKLDSQRERARHARRLLLAGYLGEKNGPPSSDPDDMRFLFESVAASFDSSAAAEPGTIQWEFGDAEPWHVVVANGETRAQRGRVDAPRVTLRARRLEDFVDVTAGHRDPKLVVARGGLRPKGDLLWLFKNRRIFPAQT